MLHLTLFRHRNVSGNNGDQLEQRARLSALSLSFRTPKCLQRRLLVLHHDSPAAYPGGTIEPCAAVSWHGFGVHDNVFKGKYKSRLVGRRVPIVSPHLYAYGHLGPEYHVKVDSPYR